MSMTQDPDLKLEDTSWLKKSTEGETQATVVDDDARRKFSISPTPASFARASRSRSHHSPSRSRSHSRHVASHSRSRSPHVSRHNGPGLTYNVAVSNIHYAVHSQELRRLFNDCGEIAECSIICDSVTGRPRGFGFVSFKSKEAQQKALRVHGTEMRGRCIKVQLSEDRSTLFVSNLPINVTTKEVEEKIRDLAGPFLKLSKKSSYCFVVYSSTEDASTAMKHLEGATYLGRALAVKLATNVDGLDSVFRSAATIPESCLLYVRNLPRRMHKSRLRARFEKFGDILRVEMGSSTMKGTLTQVCFAFIEFDNLRAARKALRYMDDERIDECVIHVEYARNKRPTGRRPTRPPPRRDSRSRPRSRYVRAGTERRGFREPEPRVASAMTMLPQASAMQNMPFLALDPQTGCYIPINIGQIMPPPAVQVPVQREKFRESRRTVSYRDLSPDTSPVDRRYVDANPKRYEDVVDTGGRYREVKRYVDANPKCYAKRSSDMNPDRYEDVSQKRSGFDDANPRRYGSRKVSVVPALSRRDDDRDGGRGYVFASEHKYRTVDDHKYRTVDDHKYSSRDKYASGGRDKYASGGRDKYASGGRDKYASGGRDKYATRSGRVDTDMGRLGDGYAHSGSVYRESKSGYREESGYRRATESQKVGYSNDNIGSYGDTNYAVPTKRATPVSPDDKYRSRDYRSKRRKY
eukprot:123918_1